MDAPLKKISIHRNNKISRVERGLYVLILGLVATSLTTGAVLASTPVSADDSVVSDVSVTVAASCTFKGIIGSPHTASIESGRLVQDIGTTTLKAFCNDNGGFSIYAIGYTDEEYGKTVLSSQNIGDAKDIATGTNTTGNSSWAMKLDNSQSTAFPTELDNGFGSYSAVPTAYTQVAHRNGGTDLGTEATGAILTSTYQAYISSEQPADSYQGKVKYTMVHPSTAEAPVNSDQVGVTYNGNGLTFASGATKNRVVYGPSCTPMYIATTPEVVETSNLTDGVQNGSYASDEHVLQTKSFSGASKVRVVIDYGLTDEASITVAEGTWGGWDDSDPTGTYDAINTWDLGGNITGSKTYTFNGDSATVEFYAYNEATSGYDYGMYAKFYPIYSTSQSGTEETSICTLAASTGTYAETTTWKGKWYITSNNQTTFLENEAAVINYLEQNTALLGTNVNIYAYNPYAIIYNGNNATAGTMTGFTTSMDTTTSTANLMAPNFKRTNYGFAGWSEDSNATVNSSSKIYGPNEKVLGSDLNFNSSTHETTLYAVWVPTAGDMQSFSCSSLGNNQITALTDSRDGNVYTVGKMQDGNCWMMENMRLDNTATISSTNTNNPISSFTALSATSDSWCTSTGASCTDQSMLNTNNINIGGNNASGTTLTVAPGVWNGAYYDEEQYNAGNNDHSQWYGYGNYYNWYSATAGNGTRSKSSGNTAGDICPTGWQLPSGGSGGQFSSLDSAMGGTGSYQYDNEGEEIVSNRWRSYPNNFIYSGGWGGSSADGRGYYGDYWSRTANFTYGAYSLSFNSSSVSPGAGGSNKGNGSSVRCIAQ